MSTWKCQACGLVNSNVRRKCQACFEEKVVFDKTTYKSQCFLFVHGYIKRQKYIEIPPEIVAVLFMFYFVGFVFDVVTDGAVGIIKGNGKTFITKGATFSGRATVAWSKRINHGVHTFKLRIKSMDEYHDWDIIGITTKIENCKTGNWFGSFQGKTYFIQPSGGDGWIITNGSCQILETSRMDQQLFDAMNKGDTLQMIVNCNSWTLEYYANETSIASFDIEQNRTYYVCMQSQSKASEYDFFDYFVS
eukprot:530497_1